MPHTTTPIDPRASIGHVHLRVADLDRATAFYRDVLGFTVRFYGPDSGQPAVFLAAGDHHHHHIVLSAHASAGAIPPPPGHTGLHHFAIRYPDKAAFAKATQRLLDHGHPIDGARDHGGTLSVYLRDADGNGIELLYDRPMVKAEPFEVEELLSERPLTATC